MSRKAEIWRSLTGPGGAGASGTIGRANLAVANYEPAIDPTRGINARKPRVATLPRCGTNLTAISATFPAGYKAAANIVPAAKPKLRPTLTLVEFPIE
jgi:hypothetical protein